MENTWEHKAIGTFGRIVTGKTPPTSNTEYFGGEYLFVSPKDLDYDSFYIKQTETNITELALAKFKNQVLPPNAVMFTCLSYSFGKIGIATSKCISNQQINSIIVNEENNYYFIYYLLRVSEPYIFQYNSGIDTPLVPKSVFEKIKLYVPKLPIQEKIASILTAYDDLIEVNNERIKLLEETAKELYKEWFVRMRFPGYKKAKFTKGIPIDWKLKPIKKAFEITGGGTPSTAKVEYWDGEINWFTPSDITSTKGVFLSNSSKKITERGLKDSSAKLVPPYSIMMTSRATIGAIGINTTPACTNQGFITCLPNKEIPYSYLYFWLSSHKETFEVFATGSTFLEITKGVFNKLRILIPSQPLIDRYHSIAHPIFQQIETLQTQNMELATIRDRLLPRLISGKLPVKSVM